MNILSIEASTDGKFKTTAALPPDILRIVLTGFMGAGKSTVGRLLADQLGWTFLDLDARLESSALASALRQPQLVLALGGGAPETLTNRLLLEQTPGTLTIFLDAPFATLFDRCMLQALNPGQPATARDADRPNLRDPGAAEARFNLRHPLYRRLARITVDTAAITPGQTVPAVLHAIEKFA